MTERGRADTIAMSDVEALVGAETNGRVAQLRALGSLSTPWPAWRSWRSWRSWYIVGLLLADSPAAVLTVGAFSATWFGPPRSVTGWTCSAGKSITRCSAWCRSGCGSRVDARWLLPFPVPRRRPARVPGASRHRTAPHGPGGHRLVCLPIPSLALARGGVLPEPGGGVPRHPMDASPTGLPGSRPRLRPEPGDPRGRRDLGREVCRPSLP